MSLNVHTDIELTPTATKVLAPLWRFSAKRSRPDNRDGIKQVYFWRPSRPNENAEM